MNMNDPIQSVKERLALAEKDRDSVYTCKKREFMVLPEVFPPTHFQSTGIFTNGIEYQRGKSFLEIGCGSGITAVTAALEGCSRVVASDISIDAVNNTKTNVTKHNVSDIVSVRHGDLFDVLENTEKFDTIFWNSNFVFVPDNYKFKKNIHRAFCDPGYSAHTRFLQEAPNYLVDGGEILLGFSGQGNDEKLHHLLVEHKYTSRTVLSESGKGIGAYHYEILHLIPSTSNRRLTVK